MELYRLILASVDDEGAVTEHPFPGYYPKQDGLAILERLIDKGIPAFMRQADARLGL